jgi:hypothetical protein
MCQQRHRRAEWLRFLRLVDRRTPKGLTLHPVVGNYATHDHPEVQVWLTKHPRFVMHFTPTGASWLNVVERFIRDITERWRASPRRSHRDSRRSGRSISPRASRRWLDVVHGRGPQAHAASGAMERPGQRDRDFASERHIASSM